MSDFGIEQAERTAMSLTSRFGRFEAIYSSPLQRARATAAAFERRAGAPAARQLAGLVEARLGEWNGESVDAIDWEPLRSDATFVGHGGESPGGIAERVAATLHDVAAQHAGGHVLVVSHAGAIAHGLAELIEGAPLAADRYWLGNADHLVVDVTESWQVRSDA